MKKVCIYTNHYDPEQFKLNDISRELVKKGYDVKVITQTPNYPSGSFFSGYGWFKKRHEMIDDHIEVMRLPVIPRKKNPIMLMLNYLSYIISSFFYATFTRDQADVVLVYCTSPLFICWAGLRFAKRRRLKATLYLMDLWPGNLFAMFNIPSQRLKNAIERMCIKIYRRFDSIMISSQMFEEVLVDYGVTPSAIHYVPQHAEFDDHIWTKPLDTSTLKIIFTGNIGQAQGLDLLVGVSQRLKEAQIDNVKFTLLGDGRYKQPLIELIREHNVMDYFTFIDPVARHEVIHYLNQNDFGFVSLKSDPVISRTLPAKVQSYMAAGIPILASGEGETQLTLKLASCGFCAQAESIDDCVRVIKECMALDPLALEEMGKNGYTYSRENFSLDKLVDQMVHIMKEE